MIPIKDIQLYLLDLDGTIYNENELIPGAAEFFDLLNMQGKKYAFMTNNSSKGKKAYVDKLTKLGIYATEEHIASSVNATVSYLRHHKEHAKLYVIGTESFREELVHEGFRVVSYDYRKADVDYVVLGFDTELTYEKLVGGCYYISRGYEYVATNCDLKCPVLDNKFIPDCGSIAHMIEDATGISPLFLGKPNRAMVDVVSKRWGVPVEKIGVVGDRLYTDIQVGINAGANTICVLTGETTQEEIKETGLKVDYCFDSIMDLYLAIR